MEKNFIYSKLVRDDDDIIGIIAYGIYKKHKIEFIESIKKEYNREPNQEEWHAFAVSSNTDSQLGKYVSQADSTLASFVILVTRMVDEQYNNSVEAVITEPTDSTISVKNIP